MENLSENLERYIDCISFLYDLSDDVKADEVKNLLENLINEAKDIIAKEISPLEHTIGKTIKSLKEVRLMFVQFSICWLNLMCIRIAKSLIKSIHNH